LRTEELYYIGSKKVNDLGSITIKDALASMLISGGWGVRFTKH